MAMRGSAADRRASLFAAAATSKSCLAPHPFDACIAERCVAGLASCLLALPERAPTEGIDNAIRQKPKLN